MKLLRDLVRHMEWADARVWTAVFATPAAAGDERLRNTLFHIHMVQRSFFLVWTGGAIDFPKPFDDLEALHRWRAELYPPLLQYVASVDESRLDEPVALPWASFILQRLGREPAPTTLGETMLQVTAHSTYHRGQANARLRELGGEPPLVDYIAWLWLARPAAEWPAR